MQKLLFFIFGLFFFFVPFFASSDQARAEFVCPAGITGVSFDLGFTPPLTQDQTSISVTVKHNKTLPDDTYALEVSDSNDSFRGLPFPGGSKSITMSGQNDLSFTDVAPDDGRFELGTARVTLRRGAQTICYETFNVVKEDSVDNPAINCKIEFTTDLNPNSGIAFRVNDLPGKDGDSRGVVLLRTDKNGKRLANDIVNTCKSNNILRSSNGYRFEKNGIDTFAAGFYKVKVTDSCEPFLNTARAPNICKSPILIEVDSDGGKIVSDTDDEEIPLQLLSAPCDVSKKAQWNDKEGCKKIKTAIGTISTDTNAFVRNILGLVLSISGGILILLLIFNGYKLMTSQGDPEKTKDARDGIISGIAGLLLIIFSIVLLRLITVDVLGLPGFL